MHNFKLLASSSTYITFNIVTFLPEEPKLLQSGTDVHALPGYE